MVEIQPLAKRKRCGPPLFATTPSPSRGVKRAKRRLEVDDTYTPNSGPSSPVQSPFLGAIPPIDSGIFTYTHALFVVVVREGYQEACTMCN